MYTESGTRQAGAGEKYKLAGLEDSLVLKAEIGGNSLDCLVDTGASVSLVPKEVLVQPTDKKLRSINSQNLDVSGEVEQSEAIGAWAISNKFVVCCITTGQVLRDNFL